MTVMPKRKRARRGAPATIQSVVARLDQMQDLLVELRGALDFQLRAIKKLQSEVDLLNESKRRPSRREFYAGEPPSGDVAHEPSQPRK
jgi:hypothetical protein